MSAVADPYEPNLQHPDPASVGTGFIGEPPSFGLGQTKTYVTDPNTEGVVPDDKTMPGECYQAEGLDPTIYGWSVSQQKWV